MSDDTTSQTTWRNDCPVPIDLVLSKDFFTVQQRIYLLAHNRSPEMVRYDELARMLGYELSTIRRVCSRLVDDNLVKRMGGGIVTVPSLLPDVDPEHLKQFRGVYSKGGTISYALLKTRTVKQMDKADQNPDEFRFLTYRVSKSEIDFAFDIGAMSTECIKTWSTLHLKANDVGLLRELVGKTGSIEPKEAVGILIIQALTEVTEFKKGFPAWAQWTIKNWQGKSNLLQHLSTVDWKARAELREMRSYLEAGDRVATERPVTCKNLSRSGKIKQGIVTASRVRADEADTFLNKFDEDDDLPEGLLQ